MPLLLASLMLVCGAVEPIFLRPDFQNLIQPGQSGAVTLLSGIIGQAGSSNTPNSGGIFLVRALIGQPIAGEDAQILGSTVQFGQPIIPDATLGIDATLPPAEVQPEEGARWMPGLNQLVAASPGFVAVKWRRADKTTNSPVRYQVLNQPWSGKAPVHLYHTHGSAEALTKGQPAQLKVPAVTLPATLNSLIHYNPALPADDQPRSTNRFLVRNLSTGNLESAERSGLVLIEFRDLADTFRGYEIVQVLSPTRTGVPTLEANVGDHLQPQTRPAEPATPFVAYGADPSPGPFIYQHALSGAQRGDVYVIRSTRLAEAGTVPVEIFWRFKSINNVEWPFEQARYTADWPFTEPSKYQRYVRNNEDPFGPAVSLGELQAELQEFQEPVGHAQPISQSTFETRGPGWSLLKYTLPQNRVAFQVVHSVMHNDVNENFALTPSDHPIGAEILPPDATYLKPGYIHQPEGDKYDWEIYDGVKAGVPVTKQIYAVNTGVLEVWWNTHDAFTNAWPSFVRRYQNTWTGSYSNIVIASTAGYKLDSTTNKNISIYYQNDPKKPGFNPNDEHAIIDVSTLFALRNDLGTNNFGITNSQPYVLVRAAPTNDLSSWHYHVLRVLAEDETIKFQYSGKAGTRLNPPQPLNKFYSIQSTGVSGPFWADKDTNYFAMAAGANGGPADIIMRWFYLPNPDFYFPEAPHSRPLQPTPLLDLYAGTPGIPVHVHYTITWPKVNTLDVGETLITRKKGLPVINRSAESVEIIYQQATTRNPAQSSVVLIDPITPRSVPFPFEFGTVERESQGGRTYFPKLPPSLYERLYFSEGRLYFQGVLKQPAAGEPWLLINVITEKDLSQMTSSDVTAGNQAFKTALEQLGKVCAETMPIPASGPKTYNAMALTAGAASAEGYVTLAFKNNRTINPSESTVIEVIKVNCPLYSGMARVIPAKSVFDEAITLRFDGDLAGKSDGYIFKWEQHKDVDGTPPNENSPQWKPYGVEEQGRNEITIRKGGALADVWYRVAYRPAVGGLFTCGPSYTAFTQPQLAEGWIKRVLSGVNEFDACFDDLGNPQRGLPTIISMLSRAGKRWTGNVPLSNADCDQYGLIELYESVYKRGVSFSIDASPPLNDPAVNNALLLVAGKISRLYMLLGNEAFADAADPTVAISAGDQYQGAPASIHSFMDLKLGDGVNGPANLLQEELCLLRGRDDSYAPGVLTPPFYNRLIWNFSGGDGQVAYKLNYGITDQKLADGSDPNGVIDENDAAVLYPQGHGDAWGHYLTATKLYYRLLRNSNYVWHARSEAVSIAGVPVTVDFLHERNFARSAAAKARTGAEIVNLTYRSRYSEDPLQQWRGYGDSAKSKKSADGNADTSARAEEVRAWGVADWADRAGQGALLDWVVGNALLPAESAEYYRIAPATIAGLAGEARFSISAAAITNALISIHGADIVFDDIFITNHLHQLDGQQFVNRSQFYIALSNTFSAQHYEELAPLIARLSQTGGIPEAVFPAVAALQDTFFPTVAALDAAVLSVLGGDSNLFDRVKDLLHQHMVTPAQSDMQNIERIDRSRVVELREIVGNLNQIQAEIDKADLGLNPLGLVKSVIPFDIDPVQLDSGKSHFEQIYERAVTALNNAIAVFNRASGSTQGLRRQADEHEQFQAQARQREADFQSRMIEIFGYPYADDIGGAGTYALGYTGPDIYHFSYVDYSELIGTHPGDTYEIELNLNETDVNARGAITKAPKRVKFNIANGFGELKPATWTGRRRAPGEIQRARSDLIQTKARFDKGLLDYNNLLEQIEDQASMLRTQYALNDTEVILQEDAQNSQRSLNQLIRRSRERQLDFATKARMASLVANAFATGLPSSIILGLATGGDPSFIPRQAILLAGNVINEAMTQNANLESLAELDHQQTKEIAQSQTSLKLATKRNDFAVQQALHQIEQLIRTSNSLELELYSLQETLLQSAGNYQATLARGERLREEFLRYRQETAAEVSNKRYKDLAFRIFRNDALQKYRAQFDLAAAYVYMAARAYDFDSGMLGSDTRGAGQKFLSEIVRTRAIGLIQDGKPQTANSQGDAGLADPMARMSANWLVLRGQLGFNNPQQEQTRFSLRSELFRILPGTDSARAWRETLEKYVVPDLMAIPEFQRFASFLPGQAQEPGIVIPFHTDINVGQNFFGWPLGGGDNAYDPNHFATKVRGVGVWFANYNTVGLASAPRIYLLPVGEDYLRSPTSASGEIRAWTIVDQRLPIPFPVSGAAMDSPTWIPINDTLGGASFIDIRRFAPFRAYHDSGFTLSEVVKDSRLVGRSVWNSRWLLVIPANTLGQDRTNALQTFINGRLVNGKRDGNGISDIRLIFQTYAHSGF